MGTEERLMLLNQLFEAITRTGKGDTAVVGWGRGMGHKGHMMLASSVITKAKEVGGDPYFVVSRTVGKDDPITPEEKLAIYKKVFPEQGHIFQAASDEIPDLTKVLANLNKQGYKNAVVVVGADQVKAFQYLKNYNGKPTKAGDIPFEFDNLEVISRQETTDPSAGEEGPRATPMRQALNDPNKSEEEQFAVWRDAMSPEVSDDEVRDLMNKAKTRMGAFVKPKKEGMEEATEYGIPDSTPGQLPGGAKMTFGEFKKMWPGVILKRPSGGSLAGSVVADVEGWMNNPKSVWEPLQGVAEGSLDDIEDTRQFRNAIALAKSQKAIRHAKHGKDTKFYADGTPVTPEETARRAAERKTRKQGVAEANPNQQMSRYNPSGATYKGAKNKMPTLDPQDPVHNADRYDTKYDEPYDPNDKYDQAELQRVMAKQMSTLTDTEKTVIDMRFYDDMTLADVAKKLGVSSGRIRQIEAKAIRKLKHPSRSDALQSFLTQGVEEGFVFLSPKEKGSIQNIVSQLSDIPGMWDHAAQTFTPDGEEKLKSALKDNSKYIKYAMNLTADDFEAEAAPAPVRAAGGAALGALSGVGGALIGQMFAPFIGATAGGIAGAVSGYKVGADATDALWDKVSNMFGGDKEAQQAGIVHAKAAAKGEKTFNYNGKEYPVKLKSTDASNAAKAVNQVASQSESMREAKQRLDPKCWTGYRKQGTKMKGGKRVNNCVKIGEGWEDIMTEAVTKLFEGKK